MTTSPLPTFEVHTFDGAPYYVIERRHDGILNHSTGSPLRTVSGPYTTSEGARAYAEALAYNQLCDEARSLGIPTSLDDPRTPRTVEALEATVAEARDCSRPSLPAA